MFCSSLINSSIEVANECISASNIPQFDSINFNWNAMQFSATSESFGTGAGIIKISAVLGRLFYTIENENLRNEAIKIVHQNNRFSEDEYTLEKDGTITFSSTTTIDKKARGDELIQALTMIMMDSSMQLKTLKNSLKSV